MLVSGGKKAVIAFEDDKWKGLYLMIDESGKNEYFNFGLGWYYCGHREKCVDLVLVLQRDFVAKTTFSFCVDSKHRDLLTKSM